MSTATATQTGSTTATESCCAGGQAKANPLGHHGAICHVEFTVPDLQKAKDFYGPLFKWDVHNFQPKELYFMSPQGGPCGCILEGTPAGDEKTAFYVNVDDIAATLDKASKMGARVTLPKTEIPGGHGWIAKFRAPEGNVLGLYSRH